ncbi:MAG: peptidoglycan editing factor PgeF [Dokdonella sp.]|uniref:peptidoglycan editing factor PgeF n=1 Tax=Dokdonella sp. TaxID=2291710 RepID=UPI003F80841C
MSVPIEGVITPDWPAPANVRACVTTRQLPGHSLPPFEHLNLGGRSGDSAQAVAANRASLLPLLGLPSAPLWLRQVHGIDVLDADAGERDRDADASVTRTAGTVLAILTADCLPVLFCSADGDAVAAAHAGWRGLAAGVLEATLGRFGGARVHAWIGPAIGARAYEVGAEVRDAFVAADAGAAAWFAPTRPGHWLCDLAALARRRLTRAGVGSVHGGGFDTFTDARFYSYRRERDTGRFASRVWIAP